MRQFTGKLLSCFFSYFLIFTLILGVGLLPVWQTGCSQSNDSNGGNGQTVPEDFNELMQTINSQGSTVNTAAFNFAIAFQAFFGANLNTLSGAQIQAAVSGLSSNSDAFISAIQFYSALIQAYASQTGANLQLGKFQSVGGGIDTLASDVGSVVGDTVSGEANCAAQANLGTDNEDLQLYKDCIDQLRSSQLAQVANIGVGSVLGGGAGAVAGLAAGAAGASLLVPIAVGTGVGIVAGVVWNWCTSSSNVKFQATGDVCVLVSCEDTVTTFPNGQQGIACSVPPGSGTVTIYTEDGIPIVRTLTITADGQVVDTTNCSGSANTASSSDASACISGTTDTSGADLSGDCDDILILNANANPADPAPNQSVTVTYSVFPKASGCPTNYSVSGTDGYSDNGSPSTDANGAASFVIPGGVEGIVDTVNVSETTNNNSKTIVYTF